MQNLHRTPNASAGDRAFAISQMEKFIEQGRMRSTAAVTQVMTEVPTDRVIRAEALSFEASERGVDMLIPGRPRSEQDRSKYTPDGDFNELMQRPAGTGVPTDLLAKDVQSEAVRFGMHRHALHQTADRLSIPARFVDDLAASDQGDWAKRLLAHNLNTLMQRRFAGENKRFLTREYGGLVRGVLSDRFRRMDSRPILDSIIKATIDAGGLIVDGHAGEVGVHVKAILPEVVEPIPGEYIVFGFGWKNSDYGAGANELYSFIERLWCLNGAHVGVEMRKVHLGGRLSEDVEYSERTYALDTAAMAAAVNDTTKYLLSKNRVDALSATIRRASEDTINPKAMIATLRKHLTKGEAEEVIKAFNTPDVVNLPPGNTTWRMSNAISWIANQTKDAERALHLQDVAGRTLKAA